MQRYGERLAIGPRRLATVVTALHRGLVLEELVAPAEVSEELIVEANLALLRGVRGGNGTQRSAGGGAVPKRRDDDDQRQHPKMPARLRF